MVAAAKGGAVTWRVSQKVWLSTIVQLHGLSAFFSPWLKADESSPADIQKMIRAVQTFCEQANPDCPEVL